MEQVSVHIVLVWCCCIMSLTCELSVWDWIGTLDIISSLLFLSVRTLDMAIRYDICEPCRSHGGQIC